MSAEYEANHGIGYASVEFISDDTEAYKKHEGNEWLYLNESLGDEFETFQMGDLWSGVFVTCAVVKEPFSNGELITGIKDLLDNEIKRLGIRSRSVFGMFGGLLKS